MPTIVLVHGTFATGAEWTTANSALRTLLNKQLSEQHDQVNFIPVAWSGRNELQDRQNAAETILNSVVSIKENNPNERIFIIGHSHGGSAISYFLKNYCANAPLVNGVIFLSTPFISASVRPNIGTLIRIHLYFNIFLTDYEFIRDGIYL